MSVYVFCVCVCIYVCEPEEEIRAIFKAKEISRHDMVKNYIILRILDIILQVSVKDME